MEETDSRFIDLYDEFGDKWANYYFSNDGHLNPAGHHRLAELLSPLLAAELTPPP
jgi:lysophospholipase L1-like esterase